MQDNEPNALGPHDEVGGPSTGMSSTTNSLERAVLDVAGRNEAGKWVFVRSDAALSDPFGS